MKFTALCGIIGALAATSDAKFGCAPKLACGGGVKAIAQVGGCILGGGNRGGIIQGGGCVQGGGGRGGIAQGGGIIQGGGGMVQGGGIIQQRKSGCAPAVGVVQGGVVQGQSRNIQGGGMIQNGYQQQIITQTQPLVPQSVAPMQVATQVQVPQSVAQIVVPTYTTTVNNQQSVNTGSSISQQTAYTQSGNSQTAYPGNN